MSSDIFGIESPDDVKCEFEYNGVVYPRWIGKGAHMPRAEILKIAMLSANICPTKRDDVLRVTIKTRKELARWKPTNQKPAW
jgi:hypothetical protein